jgi:DNA-binding NarL/FixJ family response regulator
LLALRSLLVEIYPPQLDGSSLAAALRDLVAPARQAGAEVSLVVDGADELPDNVAALVWRTAQVCVRNTVRHGEPSHLDISVHAAQGSVRLVVADEGAGLDPESDPARDSFGLEVTAALREATSDAAVVVVTSFSDRDRIVGAIDTGAVGYLLKDASPNDVLAWVRAAARGESPLHPKAARELVSARASSPARGDVELTARETEVLGPVRQGLSNKQIARRLGITERTVKAHLTSCFQRIGVLDRTQAPSGPNVTGSADRQEVRRWEAVRRTRSRLRPDHQMEAVGAWVPAAG